MSADDNLDSVEGKDSMILPLISVDAETADRDHLHSEEGNIPINDAENFPKDESQTQDKGKGQKLDSPNSSEPPFSSYAKKNKLGPFPIRKIFITVDGNILENDDFVRSCMRLSEGDLFNAHVVDEISHSLFATNIFEDIQVSTTVVHKIHDLHQIADITENEAYQCFREFLTK
jgi:hypothetical protein